MSRRSWPALIVEAPSLDDPRDAEELVAAALDDFAPQAIEDLAELIHAHMARTPDGTPRGRICQRGSAGSRRTTGPVAGCVLWG